MQNEPETPTDEADEVIQAAPGDDIDYVLTGDNVGEGELIDVLDGDPPENVEVHEVDPEVAAEGGSGQED